MASRYPAGLLEYVKENYMQQDTRELVKNVRELYQFEMTTKAMNSLKKRYGLKGGPRVKVESDLFSKEIREYMKNNHKGIGPTEMTRKIEEEFGQQYTKQQIKSYYKNHGLNSGLTGHFKKGQASHNKGKKLSPEQYERARGTMFKPGNRPHNTAKIGDRALRSDGYWKTKIAEPNVWEFDHKLVWMENFGEIPPGMMVSFKDGDKNNLDPSNLMLETLQEHGVMNSKGLRSECAELTEVGLQVAKLKITIREKRKKHGKERKEAGGA